MRKQLAAARNLPFQRIAQCIGVDRDQHEIVNTEKMLGCGGAHLAGRGVMDEAVGYIDRRTAEHAGTFRLPPKRSVADFIDSLCHGLGRFDLSGVIATRMCRVQDGATAASGGECLSGFNAMGPWMARGYAIADSWDRRLRQRVCPVIL